MAFGTTENADWWTTNLNPGTVNCPVVVNTDALNDLPDAHREALMGSVDAALDHYISFYENNTMKRWGPVLDEKGIERITYSKDDLKAFEEKVAGPAAKTWIEENKAKGLPAQELYDFVTQKIAETAE
jgi:TRAP-type mannitol/chloroaromatic compound transport system substrate-binding protein